MYANARMPRFREEAAAVTHRVDPRYTVTLIQLDLLDTRASQVLTLSLVLPDKGQQNRAGKTGLNTPSA